MALLIAGLLCAAPAMAKKQKPGSAGSGDTSTSSVTYSSGDLSSAINDYLNSTSISASACADPSLSQPFAGFGDTNYYALAPGQSDSNFTGTNWYLSGGAKIVSTTLLGNNTGTVLDLPSGSLVISPPMCLAYNYPTARTMIRDVSGSGGVDAYVAYLNGGSYTVMSGGNASGNGNNWTLSGNINLQPASTSGWQVARFALYASGSGEYQLYNFYVDPYAKR